MIVMAIMAILSVSLITGTRSSNDQVALSTSQATVAGILNRAKSLALAKWNSGQSSCGFGVNFDLAGNAAILFQDIPPSGVSCEDSDHLYAPGRGEEVQTFQIDSRLELLNGDTTSVVFLAPYLKTIGAGTITLKIKGTAGKTAAVQVTEGGSITIL
jgi:type II secretory pathway pseudopilin PulG